jgi:hypothetical protein
MGRLRNLTSMECTLPLTPDRPLLHRQREYVLINRREHECVGVVLAILVPLAVVVMRLTGESGDPRARAIVVIPDRVHPFECQRSEAAFHGHPTI